MVKTQDTKKWYLSRVKNGNSYSTFATRILIKEKQMIDRYYVGGWECEISIHSGGDYVKYTDHLAEIEKLKAQRDELIECLDYFKSFADPKDVDYINKVIKAKEQV